MAVAALPLAASAGIVFEMDQKIDGPMKMDQKVKTYVEGDMMRIDMGTMTSVIMDTAKGEMISLMPAQKMAMKMDAASLAKMQEMQGQAAKPEAGGEAKIEATGKKEKIAGLEAEEYKVESAAGKGTMWIAKDFPKAKEMTEMGKKLTAKMGKGGAAGNNAAMTEAMEKKGIAGYPVKTDMEVEQGGMKMHVVSTLTSVEEKAVEADLFKVPEGYNVQDMAAMLGGGAPGGAPKAPAVPKAPKATEE